MLDKLKNLIDVKSIITILLTVVFCILTLKSKKNYITRIFNNIYNNNCILFWNTISEKCRKQKSRK